MWKELKVCERTYFLHCCSKPNALECLLYDLNEILCERVTLDEALTRVKTLNKRIQYDETTMRDTLEQSQPTTSIWEQDGENTAGDGLTQRVLKLKYHVDKLPFNFEWHLNPRTGAEFTRSLVAPLFQTVNSMSQLLAELQQTVSKKDIEIAEYKRQYGNLTLRHLATQPFNIDQFEEKCKEPKCWSSGTEKIVSQLQLLSSSNELSTTENEMTTLKEAEQPKVEIKAEQSPSKTNVTHTKISPRNRKRQAQELQQRRLDRKVSARRQKLEYCSNQTVSDSQSSNEPESCAATAASKRKHRALSTTDDGSDSESTKPNTTSSTTKSPSTTPKSNKPKEATTQIKQTSKMTKIESANTDSSTVANESDSELSKKVDAILAELEKLDRRSKADLINSRTELPAVSATGARTRSKH